MATYAGRYSEGFWDSNTGRPLKSTAITVRLRGTSTAATLYTDRTKATAAANPFTTDANGNGSFFAEPGDLYDLFFNGVTLPVSIPVDPGDTSGGGGAVSSVNTRTGAVVGLAEASALTAEATSRANADTTEASARTTAVSNEATARAAADAALDTRVDALEAAGPGGGSGLALVPVVKIAAYQALVNDLVLADASSGTFPVAIPVSPNVGDGAGVKKIDGSANPVTITAPVNIDGGTGAVLTGKGAEFVFIFDGSEWQVLFSTASSVLTANLRTANYALALSDLGGVVEMDIAGANTLTLQPVSSVAWPVNGIVEVFEKGAGQTTLTLGSGVAWATGQTKFKLAGQGASAALRMRAPDIWVASGELVA